ncbi:hypothetical protein D3C72_559680 [compost metagenome]
MPGAIALHFITRDFHGLALRSQIRVIAHRHFMPGVVIGRHQREGLEVLIERRQITDVHRRRTHQRTQLPQRGVLFVARLDLLGSRQFITRLSLENIGTRALALLEHVFVLLELLLVRLFLRLSDVDLVLREQCLGVVVQYANQQLLALTAKVLVGKQRLRDTFAIRGISLVIEQRLLQGQRRAVTAVVTIVGTVTRALIERRSFRRVATLVVGVTDARQQAGAANGAVFQAGIAFLYRAEEHRVIAQRLFVDLERPHGRHCRVTREQQECCCERGKLIHTAEHPYSSVSAEPARSSSGLNR